MYLLSPLIEGKLLEYEDCFPFCSCIPLASMVSGAYQTQKYMLIGSLLD